MLKREGLTCIYNQSLITTGLFYTFYLSKSESLQALLLACGEMRPSIILHARETMYIWEVLIQV